MEKTDKDPAIKSASEFELNDARLAAIVQFSDDAIVSKTLDGTILSWNNGAERIFGYSASEAAGRSITMLIPPERLNEEALIIGKVSKGEPVEHYETVRRRKDGQLIDVSLTVSPIKDSTGKIVGASKIARDITERKRISAALDEERKTLTLLNKTGALIASKLELNELVQAVTDAATELVGAKFGAFFYNVLNEKGEAYVLYTLSGAPREAFEKFGLPRNTAVFHPTFVNEGMVRSNDITADPRYGKMPPHHGMPKGHLPVRSYLAVSVVSRRGEVVGGLFFGHPEPNRFDERCEVIVEGIAAQAAVAIDNARLYDDLSKAAERLKIAAKEKEELLAAERSARIEAERTSLMKDEFLATLSHELRTPLNAILGWSALLLKAPAANDTKDGLSIIHRNSKMQAQLIDDLLDMSRIVSGKLRLNVQKVDIHEVIAAALASVKHSAEAKQIKLQMISDPAAGPIRGDPNRLQQVLWNLLNNAIKFTKRGGKVRVELTLINSNVEICVIDNGEGINPEFLPHVFERFRQADPSTTRQHGGLGLGLSIVKSLVELHGGKIEARSEGEGKGATFCMHLPLMVVAWTEPDEERQHPRSRQMNSDLAWTNLAGIRVVVVEDEEDARQLLKRVLGESGAEVFAASSCEEGIAAVKEQLPDVVLSDIGMPVCDGYEFIRQLRELSPAEGGSTPAAALTAFARPEDRTKALLAGYESHVAKPVDPAEILAVVLSLYRQGKRQ